MRHVLLAGLLGVFALCAHAGAPRVATDIPPVHALAAQVMGDLGAPELILPPGASPHGYAMVPSQAAALDEAQIVFWIGEALTPWLEGPIAALAADARVVELAELDGLTLLPIRADARFEAHDHHHGHGDHADHGDHNGHDEHADHDADDDHHRHHGHAGMDEHLWLDPRNAQVMMTAMAEALAEADPVHAATYRANAEQGRAALIALEADLAAQLAPLRGRPYIVFHDAYQYFEARFGLSAAGAVSMGDARKPSAARLREIRAVLAGTDAVCLFTEPQFPPRLAETVVEGAKARIGSLDPLGAALIPGAALYPALLEGLADNLRDCLSPS